jgi:hypothetical protein
MGDRIKEIEQQVAVLQQEIAALETEAHELKMDAAGVHPGDIVTVTSRSGTFEVQVESVDTRWRAKPWISGFKRKTDGTWGSKSIRYYSDWRPRG